MVLILQVTAASRPGSRWPALIVPTIYDAGWETAHLVGNSLGGFVALQLAARDRARSVTALAPAGGWARGDLSYRETLQHFPTMRDGLRPAAANADALMATDRGRRNATIFTTTNYQHIPADLLAHQLRGVLACTALDDLVAFATKAGYSLDASAITCPVRIVWGTSDRLLPTPPPPSASAPTGSPTPTGSSSKTSATAPNSTSRPRPRH